MSNRATWQDLEKWWLPFKGEPLDKWPEQALTARCEMLNRIIHFTSNGLIDSPVIVVNAEKLIEARLEQSRILIELEVRLERLTREQGNNVIGN